jgi:hypothetical protein
VDIVEVVVDIVVVIYVVVLAVVTEASFGAASPPKCFDLNSLNFNVRVEDCF